MPHSQKPVKAEVSPSLKRIVKMHKTEVLLLCKRLKTEKNIALGKV
jgi:hypothetical protein